MVCVIEVCIVSLECDSPIPLKWSVTLSSFIIDSEQQYEYIESVHSIQEVSYCYLGNVIQPESAMNEIDLYR